MEKDTLVVGLGNPILGDDGIGWVVAQQLAEKEIPDNVEVDTVALGGISLMERLVGYKRAIIVDAMNTGQFEVGSVQVFPLEALPRPLTGHLASAHDASLQEALQFGRKSGVTLPEEIMIVAIETPYVYDFSDELSLEAKNAVQQAVNETLRLMKIH